MKFGLYPKLIYNPHITHKVITCFFEQFEASLEVGTSFTGNDVEICCNPNKLEYEVYEAEITINNIGDGNE